MDDLYLYLISYLAIVIMFFVLFNFLSNNFLWWFIKIKSSRGKYCMVINKGSLEHYASKGWLEGKTFCYYDRETKRKEKNRVCKRLTIPDDKKPFFKLFNIDAVMVDEGKNCFIMPDGATSSGYDAIAQENLILWALQRPEEESKLKILLIITLIGIVIILLICIAMFIKVNNLAGMIQTLGQISQVVATNIP